jgi:RNA polymerase sigma factor (TIGR02999 family)
MDYVAIDRLVDAWGRGDRDSLDQLMGLVYHELHRTASALLRGEATSNRTSPTSLVNALYLELERQGRLQARDQRHFFAIAAYLMRQILVANARRRCAGKRGANLQLLSLSDDLHQPFAWHDHPETLLALEDALLRLEQLDPLKASIVDLRFFADLSIAATAEALSLPPPSNGNGPSPASGSSSS